MKVVLVRPNYPTDIKTPPLNLARLSAKLRQDGFDSIIFDALRDNISNRKLSDLIVKEKPDLVGITCLTAFYRETVELSRILKEKDLKIVIAGEHPAIRPKQTLEESKCDFVICGEGELALTALLNNNLQSTGIIGVYTQMDLEKTEGPFEKTESLEELDDLPFPDWEQLNPALYPAPLHPAIIKNSPSGPIKTSRGRSHKSSFRTSQEFYEGAVRYHSPKRILQEILYLVEWFNVKEIHFEDDNLFMREGYIEEICELILENDLNISWKCHISMDTDRIEPELLYLMKKAGCYHLTFGIESAHPQILKNIGKSEDIEAIKKAIEITEAEGISTLGHFIFGLQGETKETIESTIAFAKTSKLTMAHFDIPDVLPGPELRNRPRGTFNTHRFNKCGCRPERLPDGLTIEDLIDACSRAYREFYLKSPMRILKIISLSKFSKLGIILKRLFYHSSI